MTREERLTAALVAEYAAIFAYGPIGVRLTGAAVREARGAEAAHRSRRDALVLLLSEGGGTVPAAEPAYSLPFPVRDAATAMRLAIEIETRTAAVWRAAIPLTEADQRRRAVEALTDCAVRATRWRAQAGVAPATVAFPGRTA